MATKAMPLTHAVRGAQRGLALAIVLWFIAGMSLLVAGIVSQARVDSHMAQIQVARAKTAAAGDGAIRLMLADLVIASNTSDDATVPTEGNYRLGENQVSVRLVPVKGLIDINSASSEVLFALFSQAGIGDEEARFLAESVLQLRPVTSGRRNRNEASPLETVEDLLRVPGINRALLDVLRDFIVAGMPGSGQIDWSVAPQHVLSVLEQVDAVRLDAVRSRRDRDTGNPGATRLAPAYRADAILQYGGRSWLRRLWIKMAAASDSELPWSVLRTEAPRVLRDEMELMNGPSDAG